MKQWTGLPVSVGIAETKTLAKIANRVAKRTADTDGVFDLLACPDREALLDGVAVETCGGSGRTLRACSRTRITTALQLRQADEHWIRKHMGVVGLRVVAELRGHSCLGLEACPAPKQGITYSRAFGRAVCTLAEMEEAVSSYVSRAAEKLRGEGLTATVLTVFIMTNVFTDGPQYRNSMTCSLPVGTDATSELIRAALRGLRSIDRDGYQYKKAGVMCTALVPAASPSPIRSTARIGLGRNA